MTRIRLILLTSLAVLAVGAVASASALAVPPAGCYKVAEAGTGTFEKSTCSGAAGTKEYIKVSKFETKLKAGEWCAKTETAGAGNYTTGACTTIKTGENFIKVLVPEWAANGVAVTTAKEVESSGGTFTLTAGTLTVTCKKVTDKGKVEAGGKDIATEIKFTECTTGATGCAVKNKGGTLGTIVVTEIPTLLEEVGGKLVDKFEQKTVGATKEFVTLEFEGEPCEEAGYVTTKVKGDVAAEVKNEANGEVKLTFPTTAIVQTPKLEAFGKAAKLVGTDTEKLVNGEKLEGV
ncbi:MAG: hypothetical protein ACRDK7_00795 [Solirubrobacteraceae bacterium]